MKNECSERVGNRVVRKRLTKMKVMWPFQLKLARTLAQDMHYVLYTRKVLSFPLL